MTDGAVIDRHIDQHRAEPGRALAVCRAAEHRRPASRDGGLRRNGCGDAPDARLRGRHDRLGRRSGRRGRARRPHRPHAPHLQPLRRPASGASGTLDESAVRATLRDGALYGRGVSDDKGHLTSRLLAIDALLAARGEQPCQVKWVVEGEEEIGSVHLPAFLVLHRERLAADGACGSSGSSTTAGSRSFTRGCAASATLSCRSRRRRWMRTPAWPARFSRTRRGGRSGRWRR
jgi:hypothetical protein